MLQVPATGPIEVREILISPRPMLILSSHICVGHPTDLLPSHFPTKSSSSRDQVSQLYKTTGEKIILSCTFCFMLFWQQTRREYCQVLGSDNIRCLDWSPDL
jgi:hypothetical protein